LASTKSPARRPPASNDAGWDADESRLVVMGRIVGSFGVQGWVKVKSFAEAADALGGYPSWVVRTREGWRVMQLEEFEVHSKGPVAKLAGCSDRVAADALRGAEVAVPREALGEAGEGSLYWVDLVGLEVVEQSGESLGTIEGLFEAGDTSVMVVRKAARETMIPFVPAYVKAVDREARRVTVDWKAEDVE